MTSCFKQVYLLFSNFNIAGLEVFVVILGPPEDDDENMVQEYNVRQPKWNQNGAQMRPEDMNGTTTLAGGPRGRIDDRY